MLKIHKRNSLRLVSIQENQGFTFSCTLNPPELQKYSYSFNFVNVRQLHNFDLKIRKNRKYYLVSRCGVYRGMYKSKRQGKTQFQMLQKNKIKIKNMGIFLIFLMHCIQRCFICRPSDSTVSEDAGIEPWTVATSVLAVRRSNQ